MPTKKIFKSTLVLFISILFLVMPLQAQECRGLSREKCADRIKELEDKLNAIQKDKSTLSSQISYMDTQITLTELRIDQTEGSIVKTQEEIGSLTGKIEGLNNSLDYLSSILLGKIVDAYKRRRVSFFDVILDTEHATDLTNRLKYIQQAEETDRKVAFQMQQTKVNFEEQKNLREEKKKQLDDLKDNLQTQKVQLDNQKAAKQRLLADTKNSERAYQNLLAQAKAEFTAIQGIVAGAGTETKLREVKKGEAIAAIIAGSSCNSSGAHLHFIVQEEGTVRNPFSYLKSVDSENCSGSSCGSGDGDPFNPSGSWDWPISPGIRFNQGFGETWAVRNTWLGNIYRFHNGLDFNGASSTVQAVADGTLYRGSYSVGCALSYMKLIHKDSSVATLYLHVN